MNDDRLAELYRRYAPIINARCRQLLDDPAAGEDAAQETFIRVHRHLDRVPAEREALYWIYRVATNLCLNELRDRKVRPLPVADDCLPGNEAEPQWERLLEQRDLVRHLIAGAPAKLRPVAWLYHVDGFDQEEVARIADLSKRTVASRLAAFLRRAKKLLSGER
jgi:RNA polymerase sigma-70 factor (ECF subfamily)